MLIFEQKRLMRAKAHDKYEKKIAELSERYEHKTNECHEAWMSLTSANEQLEKVMMELNNKIYQARSLGNELVIYDMLYLTYQSKFVTVISFFDGGFLT